MGRRPFHKKSLAADPRWCSICGLRIPDNIASSNQPLFGTIDHAVPRSQGGRNVHANRFPAHRYCNARKGSKLHPMSKEVLCSIQGYVVILLRRVGMPHEATDRKLRAARDRIRLDHPTRQERREWHLYGSFYVHQWETDGGAIYE